MIHEKIFKLDFFTIKNSSAKQIVKRTKSQATDWEKIVAKHIKDF